MKIGVKNFRVFKDLATFDLRPITILVGPNNSGKSSFTKLLLLLKNGYDPLDFKKGDHHLGSYDRALNWDSDSKEMVLQSETSISFIPDKLREEIRFDEEGKVKEQSMINLSTGKELLATKFNIKGTDKTGAAIDTEGLHKVSLDIKYFIDLLYNNKDIIVNYLKNVESESHPIKTQLKDLIEGVPENIKDKDKLNFIRKDINLLNYKEQYHAFGAMDNFKRDFFINSVLVNTINSLEQDYLLYDVFVNGEKENNEFLKSKVLEYQEYYFLNCIMLSHHFFANGMEDSINSLLDFINKNVKESITKRLETDFYEKGKVELKETILGKIIFTENLFPVPDNELMGIEMSFKETLYKRFSRSLFKSIEQIRNTKYIPANRGSQERVMSSSTNDRTYQEIAKFHDINKGKKEESLLDIFTKKNHHEYLKEVLEILNIQGELITEHLENTVAVVYIEQDGRKINLADYGFGYSQLIPIVLEVYNLMAGTNPETCLIIEEPEANLHPALQAKLADILAIIIEYNPKWKLVVETHSEYLIRKLQYLVAKKEVDKDDCIIHYFNSDENVSEQEPKVKPIEINEEGNLTDNFGPGFYDEATRLQFELLKLNRN